MKFYSKSGKIYNTMIGVLSENITSKVFPSKLKKDHESDVIYRRPIISERKVTVKYGENGDDIHSHIPLKNLFDHLSVYGEITIYDNKKNEIYESDSNNSLDEKYLGCLVHSISVKSYGDVEIYLE